MDATQAAKNTPVDGEGQPPIAPDDVKAAEQSQTGGQPERTTTTTLSTTIESFTDRALGFLSHASNETLGACLVGLGASTYLLLGRVGLVIIGVAGGVVLHATWEGIRGGSKDEVARKAELERRREVGIEVAKRVLQWRTNSKAEQTTEDLKVYASQALGYTGKFGPETTAALETFTDHVIKDYVHYWYDPAIPAEESFPATCRRTFTAFTLSLSAHLQRKRPADAFLDFVTNSSSIIIVFLSELAAALNASPNSSAEDAISTYLKLKPDTSLMYILNEDSQKQKLADASEDVLQAYLDPKAYNCPPVHVFLKEVFAQLVLGATVTLCSRPEWINDWIVYGLEESETTKEVMDIVDAGVEGGRLKGNQPETAKPSTGKQDTKLAKDVDQDSPAISDHKRTMSKAEEAMDEAMREARRLTELMIAEDERRAKDEQEKQNAVGGAEDISDETTHGTLTPPSSQSDVDGENTLNGELGPKTPPPQQFTSFDQLLPIPQTTVTALNPANDRPEPPPLTLHQANISIFDDSNPGERASIKAKPTTDYLIQIEPSSSAFAGWMIARKYADFETLHEVLRRISVITGVDFAQAHGELPKWKVHTKTSLRTELERYLTDAVRYQPLAESEGMKRFLEKERGFPKSPGGGKGFGWPTPDAFGKLGGDMMNVLTKAPKQVAGGVTGLVGANNKKSSSSSTNLSRTISNSTNETSSSPTQRNRPNAADGTMGSMTPARASQDSLRTIPQSVRDRRESGATTMSTESKLRSNVSRPRPTSMLSESDSITLVEDPSTSTNGHLSPTGESLKETIILPPPPDVMPEDYGYSHVSRNSIELSPSKLREGYSRLSTDSGEAPPALPSRPSSSSAKPEAPPKEPLTERETSVAIELMFAVIVELYTLSSAWQIRRTLLTAAKSFLLRPGNPQLLSIRDLLQTSLLDANLSDSGLAYQIHKLRENGLPTEEEMEIWYRDYPEKTAEQKEELRIKARKLLVTKGMPQALTSVMGAAASGEALGKVFDCLQIPRVSRGLIFGLMLQALRVITH